MAFTRSQLQSPAFIQSLLTRQRSVRATLADVSDTDIHSTASFFYDKPGDGLKSTQQLNVDWSRFENHTFFNSAEVNVNVAFDRIINHFPFDGNKLAYEKFFENLTGFEKWVYDRFPKNVGYLNFSGSSATGSVGTHIRVQGIAGSMYPELSRNKTGMNVLDPGNRSFSVECHLFVPERANSMSVVCQKLDGDQNGFSMFLLPTSSLSTVDAVFAVVSGSQSLSARATLEKGKFNHICGVLNRHPRKNRAQFFVNSRLVNESDNSYAFGNLGSSEAELIIGSGSTVTVGGVTYTPGETLSGSIDEFRFFHEARTEAQLKAYALKSMYPIDSLKLYFKFNEPTGTLIGSSPSDSAIVIDSSGNGLHTRIANFEFSNRSTGSVPVPLVYEKLNLSPVLFPMFADTLRLNTELLVSASEYDRANPNLITRLVPQHYFQDGMAFEGLSTVEGEIGESYDDGSVPGTGKLGAAQLLSSFLYVWAKFFDEMKLFVDAFATVNNVDYSLPDTVPDTFLPLLLKRYGFHVPNFFTDSSIEQFVDAENIQTDFGTNKHALQFVQNQIHRRVLVNLLDILKSKGTIHSVKAFIRALGIDPDNSFRIREFGGPTRRALSNSRETKTEPHRVLDMFGAGSATVISPPLSSSRIEVGFPRPVGQMVSQSLVFPHGVSDNPNDGLWTSGSWTVNFLCKFPVGRSFHTSQSLMRMIVTGSYFSTFGTSTDEAGTLVNVIATSGSLYDTPAVRLWARPSVESNDGFLKLEITGSNLFDGNKWSVSFGRKRSDSFDSAVSSSYFLRLARSEGGEIEESYVTQSYFCEYDRSGNPDHAFAAISNKNSVGAFLIFGNGHKPLVAEPTVSGALFLNDSDIVPPEARVTKNESQISMIRFWSKAIDDTEWLEHVRNYRSTGVRSPFVNFNFETRASGSFERLRIDVPMEQYDFSSDDGGRLNFFDFSQNNMHLTGTGFPVSTQMLYTDIFRYGMISPLFDEASTTEKVRVRSFQSYDNVRMSHVSRVAPVFEPEPNEIPTDDTRFSIEFSIVDALNRDIINIFATLEEMDNALGAPELMFSQDYPGLERLRDVYFNKLTGKLNFRSFFEYFKWFDSSISMFISQLIPRKTKFYGTNFVIEPHMLERAKMQYMHQDNYIGTRDRIQTSRDIQIRQIVSQMRKF